MKQLIPFLLICVLSSCATLFNGKMTHFYVNSDKGAVIVYHKDYEGIRTRKQRGIQHPEEGTEFGIPKRGICIIAKRDPYKKMPVTVKKDGIEKTVYVKPVLSAMFYANLFYAFPLLSFGMLIDMRRPERCGYTHKIYIDISDTCAEHYYHYTPLNRIAHPYKTPYADIDLAPPLINVWCRDFSHMQPAASPLGADIAFNLHYANNAFVSLEGGGTLFAPIRIGETFYDDGDTIYQEKKSVWFINLKHTNTIRRFELGYGLSLNGHSGYSSYTIYPNTDAYMTYKTKNTLGLGGCLSFYYHLGSHIGFGINYQPQILSLDGATRLNYEYSLAFGVRLRLHVK